MQRKADFEEKKVLTEALEGSIPWSEKVTFGEDWEEITELRKGALAEGEEEDREIYEKLTNLPVTLNYIDLVKAFKDVRPGSVVPYEAVVGLSLDAPVLGRIRLPIDRSGELTVPSIPKASEVDWKKLLDKVTQ